MNFKNKKVLILGLNQEGISVFKALQKLGAQVFGMDLSGDSRVKERVIRELSSCKNRLYFENSFSLENISLVILAAPQGLYHPILSQLHSIKVPILSPLELVCSYYKSPLIGVTGTNGKSTVSKLIAEMLLASGKTVFLGGGSFEAYPELLRLPKIPERVVLELNSVTLEQSEGLSPHIAVLTNLVPSHFERYETTQKYFEAKARIFRNQSADDFLIFDSDNSYANQCVEKAPSGVFPAYLSNPKRYTKNIQNYSYYEKGYLFFSKEGEAIEKYSALHIKSQGYHMIMNALQALSAARLSGAEANVVQTVLDTFTGLPHRMHKCLEKNGLVFYDDSRASNPSATAWGLSRFAKPVVLILGGMDMGANYNNLAPYIKDHVKLLIIMGAARRKIFASLKNIQATYLVENLKEAVHLAILKSQKEDTIVFSPASAPEPHLYEGYQARGEAYLDFLKEELSNSIKEKSKLGGLHREGFKV